MKKVTSKRTAQSSGGVSTGILRRKIAIAEYYKKPNYCEHCGEKIEVKENERVWDVRRKRFCDYECSKNYHVSERGAKILELFSQGKKSKEIATLLGCSKSIVSYYCSDLIEKDERYSDKNIKKYQRYYDTYGGNLGKTATFFNVPKNTLREKLVLKTKQNLTKEERVDRNKKLVCDYRRRKKIMAVEYKGGRCQKCGYKKSVYCLDFHHINPEEKDFAISGVTRKWESIVKELDKCILVCRNCHGEIHEEIQLNGFSKILNKIIENKKVQVAELV